MNRLNRPITAEIRSAALKHATREFGRSVEITDHDDIGYRDAAGRWVSYGYIGWDDRGFPVLVDRTGDRDEILCRLSSDR